MMEDESNLELRDVSNNDLLSLLNLLKHLTDTTEMSLSALQSVAEARCRAGIITRVFVHKPSGQVVGTASLLVEQKFTRGGKYVGHVEDVVVDPAYRGKKLGQALIKDICAVARSRGCYKVILDSAEKAIDFYQKLGFRVCERQMRLDL
ncbi:acetyltransferase [Trypanosoma grayi]|uniref:acetyltransferase n=1 Tax=Trypanosoma grayi TaxID=71804 RepID=UPI0004F4B015|nr:acetyltransferase [Trypanosoma grayi]KEG14765.1 acetyltransferase [Trypanosoma grayi]